MPPSLESQTPPPTEPAPWVDLASHWQQIASEWSRWWMQSAHAAASTPERGTAPSFDVPPALAANMIEPQALAALNAKFAPRFQALWTQSAVADAGAAAGAAPGDGKADAPAKPPMDRRFASREWQDLPYFAFLRDGYLLDLRVPERTRRPRAAAAGGQAPAGVRDPAVRRRAVAGELSGDQPRRAEACARDRGREPRPRRREPRRRRAQGPHHDDRRGRFRGRPQPRADTRRRRLPQRADRADPVRAVHRARAPPAAADRAAVHQQVLHPRPAAVELVRAPRGRRRATRCSSSRGATSRPSSATLTWDDYLEQGVLAALAVVREVSGSRTVNALGFCVGGTLLASALAVLAARARPQRRERDVPHDDARLRGPRRDRRLRLDASCSQAREPALLAGQRMHGSELAGAFASLRANDLVWNYVVGNYLKGETPPAFDLLYWNGDSANLPGPMYAYYLREPLPRQPAARAGRADDGRRARSTSARIDDAGVRARDARRPHRALALRVPDDARSSAATRRSCSARRATSRA